jgi:uncharacterized glyoxalase superfamily protein PhnB
VRAYGAVMQSNRSAPSATVIPVLGYPDVRAAVDWLTAALGFRERVRIGEDHRAQLQVGEDGAVVVADRGRDGGSDDRHLCKIRVEDVDAAFARAVEHGATVLEELTTRNYGEREATIADPAGHRWQLTQTVRDVAPEEWGGLSFP